MRYTVFLMVVLGLLSGCERDATPQEAAKTAGRTVDQANALQKDAQQRVSETDALTGGK